MLQLVRLIRIAAALLLVSAVVAAASAARGLPHRAFYNGKTAQGTAVTVRLTSNGRRVALLEIHYRVACNDGRARPVTFTDILNIPIVRGRFAASGVYIGFRDHSRNNYTLKGAITRRTVEGGFKLTATGTVGGRGVRCDSGALLWFARFVS